MSRMRVLTILGLGAMLAASGVAWGAAAASPQASIQPYTGQVQSIKIDHCDLQPGTCEGTMVLAQAGRQPVALATPSGTAIQRGDERVHLEELGIGNYVMVQAAPLPSESGDPLGFGMEGTVSRHGSHVGTSSGERPPTLEESSEP